MNQQELDQLLGRMTETPDWLYCGEFAGTSQKIKSFAEELQRISSQVSETDRAVVIIVRHGRCRRVDDALIQTLGGGDTYKVELHRGSDVFNSEELFGHGCQSSLFETDHKRVAIVGLELLSDTILTRLCSYVRAWRGISDKPLIVVSEPGSCVDQLLSAFTDSESVWTLRKPKVADRPEDLPFELHHAALRCGAGLDRFSVPAVEWLARQEWHNDIKGLDDVVRGAIMRARDEVNIAPRHFIDASERIKARELAVRDSPDCSRLWLQARDLKSEVDQLTTALLHCPFFVPDTAITRTSPLSGYSPELDFFRIVSWGYVILFEQAEPNLRCVEKLMCGVQCDPWRLRDVKQRVGRLRTYLQHSLQYSSAHDLETLKIAADWFNDTIGRPSPSRGHFETCTRAVLKSIIDVFEDLLQFLNRVNQDEFRDELILRQWRSMRETTWPKHRFDEIVRKAIENLGRGDLKVEVVSEHLLGQMQQRLKATKETADRERILLGVAEQQIAQHYPEEPPVNGSDLIAIGVPPGPKVGELLQKVKARFRETKDPKEVLLEFAKREIDAPPGSADGN